MRTQGGGRHPQVKEGGLRRTQPHQTPILLFQAPKLGEINACALSPRLWYLLISPTADRHLGSKLRQEKGCMSVGGHSGGFR